MTEEKQPFKCDSCQECGCNTDVCKCECHTLVVPAWVVKKQDDKDQLDFWKDKQ